MRKISLFDKEAAPIKPEKMEVSNDATKVIESKYEKQVAELGEMFPGLKKFEKV